MNREQRRHPEQEQGPRQEHERELVDKAHSQDQHSTRAKSTRHKKVTADKWNQ